MITFLPTVVRGGSLLTKHQVPEHVPFIVEGSTAVVYVKDGGFCISIDPSGPNSHTGVSQWAGFRSDACIELVELEVKVIRRELRGF